MRVAVGADHAGFELKQRIVETLQGEGFEVTDLGTCSTEPVDYPEFAVAVGDAVRRGEAERGILLCGSGVGAAVAANKMRGIRAGLCHDYYSAHQCVEHDNCNVLCMGPRVIGPELAMDIAHAFLSARFSGAERHVRRLSEVDRIERTEAAG